MIYFVQDESLCLIKIGFTQGDDATERLRSMQVGNPARLTLLATMPGGFLDEQKLHERFDSARVRGEWFRPVPELIRLIAEFFPRPDHDIRSCLQNPDAPDFSMEILLRPSSSRLLCPRTLQASEQGYRRGFEHGLAFAQELAASSSSSTLANTLRRAHLIAHLWRGDGESHQFYMCELREELGLQ